MTARSSEFLKGQLASVGIFLDESTSGARRASAPPTATTTPPEPDRDAIREILVEAGVPARHVEWMVASCPSVEHAREHARTLKPPGAK